MNNSDEEEISFTHNSQDIGSINKKKRDKYKKESPFIIIKLLIIIYINIFV